jgi:hypothetical protein
MEVRTRTNPCRNITSDTLDSDRVVEERLAVLLALNSEIAREKASFRDERERLEAAAMAGPMTPEKAFSYFGLIVGSLTPATIFARLLIDSGGMRPDTAWLLILLLATNVTTALTGFFTGKLIGRTVAYIHELSYGRSLILLPLMGLIWGMASGAAGGLFLFVIGAFFGALVGGVVGAVALPVFAVLHRLMRRGEMIDRSHFLPLAFGVTLTICSFVLGL